MSSKMFVMALLIMLPFWAGHFYLMSFWQPEYVPVLIFLGSWFLGMYIAQFAQWLAGKLYQDQAP